MSPFVFANELNHNPLKSLNYLLRSGSDYAAYGWLAYT